jgi:RimJ/RimL family protein N-acetyltransferase
VPRIVEACAVEHTQTWLGGLPFPYTEEDARSWLRHLRDNLATGHGVAWAVTEIGTDAALASISYFDLVPEQEAEIGYWGHPDARGRGVVTRAMAEVLRYGFEDLGLRRMTAAAAVGNLASQHVIESNGLTRWGTERLGTLARAGRVDLVWYDVLVEEWRASHRARHSGMTAPDRGVGTMSQGNRLEGDQ